MAGMHLLMAIGVKQDQVGQAVASPVNAILQMVNVPAGAFGNDVGTVKAVSVLLKPKGEKPVSVFEIPDH